MSSRPDESPQLTPPTTTSQEPAMTEAQLSQPPALPSFDQISSSIYAPAYASRNLPAPPNATSPNSISSPPIYRAHSSDAVLQLAIPRNPLTSPRERLQSVPLERLLSAEAQTPPRQLAFPSLGPAYEPQYAPSRSLKRTRDEFSPSEESPISPLGRSPSYPSKRIARDARVDSPVRPAARMHTPHASITSSSSLYSPTQQRRESIPHETQPQPVARWVGETATTPGAVSVNASPHTASPLIVTPALASAVSVPRPVESSSRSAAAPVESPLSERWEIFVRQQPVAARACGFGERDRRVIDPPPIVQLRLKKGVEKTDADDLRYPFNVVHCTLWSEDSATDETALTGTDRRTTRRLMGTLVSSPFVALDENNNEGCFFVFPDLSCRTHGTYRLKFVLMRLEPTALLKGSVMPIIAETVTDAFTVYTAKEFPGMRPSTGLTKALKRQGCAISVKKGNEKALSAEKNEVSDGEDAPSPPPLSVPRKRKRAGE